MAHRHRYETCTAWTGDQGSGTTNYRSYRRSYETTAAGRPALPGSSDPSFRGDANRWNPELLLVAALSQCHLLWYLHLCSTNSVVVTGYVDHAEGAMIESEEGKGHFEQVVLRPVVTVARADMAYRARELHREASARCFIAKSVNFSVRHEPEIVIDASFRNVR